MGCGAAGRVVLLWSVTWCSVSAEVLVLLSSDVVGEVAWMYVKWSCC